MKKLWRFLSYVLVAVLTCVATLGVVHLTDKNEMSKLDELMALIDARYVDDVDTVAVEDAAAEAIIDSLGDRWSYYIPAAEYQAYREQMNNAYVGVGITIQLDEEAKGFRIMEVVETGPAYEAGIRAGDILIGAAGQDIRGMEADEVSAIVKGEENTVVELTVLRGEEEKTFSVTRRTIQVQVATAQMLEGKIGLITIENFDARCADETIACIEQLLEQGAVALIFDVRNNPGGYASEMVEILDYLLPEGDLFRTVDYAGNESVDRSDSNHLDIPMAVLVNGNSYSAAEFFAAALNDYDAAIIVGEQTSGKGYYQNAFQLSDGSAVSLSVGKYYTPAGISLEGVGITPEIQVTVDEETAALIYYGSMNPQKDPQIQAAVAALTE